MSNDTKILLKQIQNMIQNKPLQKQIVSDDEYINNLEDAILYLDSCLKESNAFLNCLANGKLDEQAPSRHNFLAGSVKELHAGLRHLSWQANQVANGDYSQRVSFLGDFSNSFNKMITQLEERETMLKKQAEDNMKSKVLLVSVMDCLSDWILVTEVDTGNVLYVNEEAKENFFNPETKLHVCKRQCELMQKLQSYHNVDKEHYYEFTCPINKKTLYVKSCPIHWNGSMAYAHVISDVTIQKGEQISLERMAFKDEMTGAYNRRYFMKTIKEYFLDDVPFALCMIDLDGLKYVNDKYGHAIGDEYIKTVTSYAFSVIRKGDIIARLGGDEFVIIFPDCSLEAAKQRMDKLSALITKEETMYHQAISYGIAISDEKEFLNVKEIIDLADSRMYEIKKHKKISN